MNEPAIRVQDLGIRFLIRHQRAPTVHSSMVRFLRRGGRPEEFWALRKINFEVGKGRVFGIIGPNGSGKSTMLRVLSRILTPDEGEVELRGQVSSLLSLGAGFHAELTGLENITYNGILLGLSRQEIERRKDKIIEFSGLGQRIDTPVRTYSTGMRARLGFSVAVHVDPEILVVDEVLVVGDARFRERCANKMRELFSAGTTVVMVQHNLEAVLQMCHECLWLQDGAMRQLGDPLEVVNAYLNSQGIAPIGMPENATTGIISETMPTLGRKA
ncbi:MAG: ABC transporter ATP-binding protein [Actinomycetota bacterium]